MNCYDKRGRGRLIIEYLLIRELRDVGLQKEASEILHLAAIHSYLRPTEQMENWEKILAKFREVMTAYKNAG